MLTTIGLILAGAIFLYCGIRIRNHYRRMHEQGFRTQALIIDFVERIEQRNSNDDHFRTTTYTYPIVRFTDEDGIVVEQRLDTTARRSMLDNYINIAYIKHHLDNGETDYEIIIDTELWRSQFPMIFIAIGGVLALSGILKLLFLFSELDY